MELTSDPTIHAAPAGGRRSIVVSPALEWAAVSLPRLGRWRRLPALVPQRRCHQPHRPTHSQSSFSPNMQAEPSHDAAERQRFGRCSGRVLALAPGGPSWFIVEKGTAGFSAAPPEDKHGIRLSNTAALLLDDVVVPARSPWAARRATGSPRPSRSSATPG